MKKHLPTIIIVAVLLVGLGIFAYPGVSSYINGLSQSRLVDNYKERVSQLSEEEISQMFEAATDYNELLAATSPSSFFDPSMVPGYDELLDITGTGIMAYVSIPTINVELPVYHTTDEAVLQVGVGHLQGSSLPIGGDNTHAVLSGHRGLPSSTLFTDLDKLEEGDIFTLTTLNRTVTYQIDQIRIVEPDDVDELMIVDGKDYCTLFTCTPYGVNSHRLLLRGSRIDNLSMVDKVSPDARQVDIWVATLSVGIPLLTIALLALVISNRNRRKTMEAQNSIMQEFGVGAPSSIESQKAEASEEKPDDKVDDRYAEDDSGNSEESKEGMEDRS